MIRWLQLTTITIKATIHLTLWQPEKKTKGDQYSSTYRSPLPLPAPKVVTDIQLSVHSQNARSPQKLNYKRHILFILLAERNRQ